MTFLTTQTLLVFLASTAYAFPAGMMEEAMKSPEMMARAAQIQADGATALFEPIPIFNEKAQFIDVGPGSGHEWQAPGPGDLRGYVESMYELHARQALTSYICS